MQGTMDPDTVTRKAIKIIIGSRNSYANKEVQQGLQPKGSLRVDGLGGDILT